MSTEVGLNRSAVKKTAEDVVGFAVSTQPSTIGGALASVAKQIVTASTTTAATIMTGKNYAETPVLKTNVEALSSGSNGAGNLKSGMTADQLKTGVSTLKSTFVADVKAGQAVLAGALDQSAKDLGMDKTQARDAFIPKPKTGDMGIAPDLAMTALGLPAIVSAGTSVAKAVSEIKQDSGAKLSPKEESRLAAEMYAKLTPKRDADGKVVEPAEIECDFSDQIEKMGPEGFKKFLHEAMKPPEDMPEYKMMADLETKLSQTVAVHHEHKPADKVAAVLQQTGATVDAKAVSGQSADKLKDDMVLTSMSLTSGIGGKVNVPDLDLSATIKTKKPEFIVPPPQLAMAQPMMAA